MILFGEIGVKPFGDIQLCSDFLKLTLEEPDGKNLELRMSFKQIQSVEVNLIIFISIVFFIHPLFDNLGKLPNIDRKVLSSYSITVNPLPKAV